MNKVTLDFTDISDMEEFYSDLKDEMELPDYFGNNLDALSDFISGGATLPLQLEFINISVEQLEEFEELIETLETIDEEMDGFSFRFYMEQFNESI